MNISKAAEELKKGRFILLHDANDRENEIDLVIAAEFVKPESVATMRQDAGGLLCVAVDKPIAEKLFLPFMADVLRSSQGRFPVLKEIEANDIPYDEKSAFSVSINHRKTFTGISDNDRALTISEFGKFCKKLPAAPVQKFGKNFRSPGHVHLLISSGLKNREGHTELSTALLEISGLTPVVAICEMLDSKTHQSLTKEKARTYATKNKYVFLDANEIKDCYNG